MSDDKRDDQKTEQPSPEQAATAATAAETAESFKKAASQILHDRFGIPLTESGEVDVSKLNVQEIQAQAPNLIVGLLDAFTQKLKTSLDVGAGVSSGEGGQVIDLEARKAAATQAPAEGSGVSLLSPELQNKLGGKIKEAFNQYVEQNVEARNAEGGIDVNVDLDFIRQHGKPMMSSIIRSLAEVILPKGELDIPAALKKTFSAQISTDAPAAPAAEGSEAAPAEGSGAAPAAESKQGVSVKLNVANILKNLFTPKPAGTPAAPAATPPKPTE